MKIEYTGNYLTHSNDYPRQKGGRFGFAPFGKRRYVRSWKDEDGEYHYEYTKKGEERYQHDYKKNAAKPKDKRIKADDEEAVLRDPDRWVKEDIESAQEILSASKTMIDSAANISMQIGSNKNSPRLDLSNMTTAQIKEANDREAAERRYNELFNPPKQNKAKTYVDTFFKYAVPAVTLAGGTVAFIAGIKKLREGR